MAREACPCGLTFRFYSGESPLRPHSFQVCRSVFTVGRRRLRPARGLTRQPDQFIHIKRPGGRSAGALVVAELQGACSHRFS